MIKMYKTNKDLDEIARETGLSVNGVVNAILDKTINNDTSGNVSAVFKAIKKLNDIKTIKKRRNPVGYIQ